MTERSHPLLRLLGHLREYRWQVWLASFCSIMNKFWDLAPPILIGMAIDVVTYKEDSMLADFGYPDPYDQFLILVALTVVIWVLESLFEYWFGVLWSCLLYTSPSPRDRG